MLMRKRIYSMKKTVFLLLIIFVLFEIVYNSETCKNKLSNLLARFLTNTSHIGQTACKKLSADSFIAHAGGNINGHIYTNSREAVENSLKNGFKFIEIDFLVTSDGHLVAIHDWESFRRITGVYMNTSINLKELKNLHIYNRYHVLSGKDISEIMKSNANMLLITDKIKNISLLVKEIPFKERIFVEVFNRFDYIKCLWYGVTPIYSLPWKTDELKNIMDLDASWYTLPGIFWKKSHTQLREYAATLCQQGKEVLLYTAGSPRSVDMESDEFLEKYHGVYFTKIYTDRERKFFVR